MNLIKTEIPDLVLIHPDVYPDDRGYFFESFQKEKFREIGLHASFVQDNESLSARYVLRGIHFQYPPYTQGKLVRVVRGSVQDIAVDLRQGSPTFGKWYSVLLDSTSKTMMYIPEGFGHGFLTLEDDTIFQYKCTNYYNKESEGTILWNDPVLGIQWEARQPVISSKDLTGMQFKDFDSPFTFTGN